jgi:hypothetical protein
VKKSVAVDGGRWGREGGRRRRKKKKRREEEVGRRFTAVSEL